MAHRFPHRAICISMKSRIKFQIPQRHHAADPEFLFRLLDGAESETGEVDRRTDLHLSHFQPDHAAKHAVALLLI